MSDTAKKINFLFGDYEVLQELGRGYDAVVYLAEKNGQQFAIKVPHLEHINDASSDHLERFRKEAYTLARFSHPSIPHVVEVGEHKGAPYLVMAYFKGITLSKKILAEKVLSESLVIQVGVSVAGALSEIHRHHMVHRDVKGDNILFCEDQSIGLIDLGMVGDQETVKNDGDENRVLGTLQYSSPEQSGILKRRVDARSDIYSLGITLYQLSTGHLPFESEDISELLQMHANLIPPTPNISRPELLPVLSQIIMKMIQKDPDDRYQSAAGVIYDLTHLEVLQQRLQQTGQLSLATKDFVGMKAQMGLAGRDEEVKILRETLERTKNGKGGNLLIEAESGMGKSRLAREMIQFALDDQFMVIQGKCNDKANSVPLGVIRETMDSFLRWSDQLEFTEKEKFWTQLRNAAKDLELSLYRVCSPKLVKNIFGALPDQKIDVGLDQMLLQMQEFFVRLGAQGIQLLIYIDDIQWADDLSLRLLTDLSKAAKDLKFQILLTLRKENSIEFCASSIGGALYRVHQSSSLQLEPMNALGISGFLKKILGEKMIEEAIVETVAKASGGNPLLIQEITFALLNRGDLTIEGDAWHLKASSLGSFDFSSNVYRLILSRASSLPIDSIELITQAATMGLNFTSSLLCEVSGRNSLDVENILESFVKINFVEFDHEANQYSFTHDKIREAYVESLSPEKLKAAYGRLAEIFDQESKTELNSVFSIAQFYRLSDWSARADRAFIANLNAGVQLLENYAYAKADEIFEAAEQMIELAKPEKNVLYKIYISHGSAAMNLGNLEKAFELFNKATSFARGRLDRAEIQLLEFRTLSGGGYNYEAWDKMKECLKTLGFGFSQNKVIQVFNTLFYLFRSLASLVYPFQLGQLTKNGREREAKRYKLATQALDVGMYLAYFFGDPLSFAYIGFRNYIYSFKLGDSKELVKAHCNLALFWALFVVKPLMNLHLKMSEEMAKRLKDPSLQAFWVLQRNWSVEFSGSTIEAEKLSRETISMVEKYVGSWVYSQMLADLGGQYINRGMAKEAIQFLVSRLAEVDKTQNLSMMANARGMLYTAGSMVGGFSDLSRYHSEWLQLLDKLPSNKFSQVTIPGNTICVMADAEDFGDKFNAAVDEFYRLKIEDHHFKIPFCMIAHGRLKQYEMATTPEQKKVARKKLFRAVIDVTFRASIPLWKCHLYIVKAGRCRIDNKLKKVPTLLEKAESFAQKAGADGAKYLIAREWARYQKALGNDEKALKEANYALELAQAFSYANRIQQLTKEFNLQTKTVSTQNSSLFSSTSGSKVHSASTGGMSLTDKRILSTLLHVSTASTTTLDPTEQISYVLDEIIKVFGAERGFVMVWDEKHKKLVFKGGRNSARKSFEEPKDYSGTVVSNVNQKKEPVIVTSGDDLEGLGSKSAIIHDLRSIICVPLFLKEDFKGILYIDSRLARGLFTKDDLSVLTAIANHIAIALEHTRMALVEADRREMAKDLEIGATVQNMLLPEKANLSEEQFRLISYYKPAVQCGGDWWWHKQTDEQISIFVGDVTGHGAGSAMISACIASAFRIFENQVQDLNLGELLTKVNHEFLSFAKGQYLMTGMAVQYNFKTKILKWWSAAGPEFLLLRPSEKTELFGGVSSPLGMSPFSVASGEIELKKGDRLVVYTDGIPEMNTERGSLGDRQFRKIFEENASIPIQELPAKLDEKIKATSIEEAQLDDHTLVILEVT